MYKIIKYISISLFLITRVTQGHLDVPQLTIVIVVDQLTQQNLEKLRPYLTGGLRFLLNEGIVYRQAHTPYASPETGPGHATLSTGVTPKVHGITHNTWFTDDNKEIDCDAGTLDEAVFGPNGLQPYGKSAQYIMVDSLSEQLVAQTQQHKNYHVFSLSLKCRSSICTANKMGKAIWFDPETNMVTSSKAYYDALPQWIKQFNQKQQFHNKKYSWQRYHWLPQAYNYKDAHNYVGAALDASLIGKSFNINDIAITPEANKIVFDLALACIDAHFCKATPDEKLFLWVLPSGIDKVGHMTGPNSIEVIDMIYHLDRQLKCFIDGVNCRTRKRNILWALTADHGIAPVPEQMQQEGYAPARRIMAAPLIAALNAEILENFDVENAIIAINGDSLYLNKIALQSADKETRHDIKKHIINYLEKQPGIIKVWPKKQLRLLAAAPRSLEQLYQNQLFKGRSGSLIIQLAPYCLITTFEKGTDHQTPYNYDTHIPLIIYQRAFYQRKTIEETVYNTQLAPTLAHILKVPKPSACTAEVLPGIIFKEDCCF